MFANRMIRQVVGVLFCGAAGLSLTSMVLPSIAAAVGLTDALWARFGLSAYAAHIVLLWALGGWGVAKVGSMRCGGLIMGLLGLICGLSLAYIALSQEFKFLFVLGLGACGYGVTTGLLVGKILETPAEGGQEETSQRSRGS